MPNERLLSTRQAAELFNVSARTVTNWIRADRVPYVRLPGGEYRLPLDGLLDSVSGTYDLRAHVDGALALDAGSRARARIEGERTMAERLAEMHTLSKQVTAIAGSAKPT